MVYVNFDRSRLCAYAGIVRHYVLSCHSSEASFAQVVFYIKYICLCCLTPRVQEHELSNKCNVRQRLAAFKPKDIAPGNHLKDLFPCTPSAPAANDVHSMIKRPSDHCSPELSDDK